MDTTDKLAHALRDLIGCADPQRDRNEIKAARDALRLYEMYPDAHRTPASALLRSHYHEPYRAGEHG